MLLALLLLPAIALAQAPAAKRGENAVRIATYNIENFKDHFTHHHIKDDPAFKDASEVVKELLDQERRQNEEDNWEISQVILDPAFMPDILVIQECAGQEDLEYFNKKWLNDYFATVTVFPTNTTRNQNLAVMLRPGYTVLEVKDFHTLPDVDDANPEGDYLFARGPAFVKVRSPGGEEFWVGTTHQKSKSGNDEPSTRWRHAEAVATNKIVTELASSSPNVVLLGDMNDELGIQAFELQTGGDVTEALVGKNLTLLTRKLAEDGQASFGGYWNDTFRSFIDHAVATPDAAKKVTGVAVFRSPWAQTASDHFPVYVDMDLQR